MGCCSTCVREPPTSPPPVRSRSPASSLDSLSSSGLKAAAPPEVSHDRAAELFKPREEYTLGEVLDTGRFGTVHRSTRSDGSEVAVKVLTADTMRRLGAAQLLREICIMSVLRHPNVIGLECVVQDVTPKSTSLWIVMPLLPGTTLQRRLDAVGSFDEGSCRGCFRQIVLAVRYLHGISVVHRDLKPENCVVDSADHVTVVDFGTCAVQRTSLSGEVLPGMELRGVCGTPCFIAPEVAPEWGQDGFGRRSSLYNGFAADMWALGVVLYCMLQGRRPFCGRSTGEVVAAVKSGAYEPMSGVSAEASRCCACLLTKDPSRRASADVLLRSEWMRGEDADGSDGHVSLRLSTDAPSMSEKYSDPGTGDMEMASP
eukprot:TRINITY_DN8987_c2_g1_i1.p1 TRINITY_DN8987_c2_g1~~TRINITY_DN8987_c2_g1_i1.p1  ORF type:complete len:371 (+),score=94.44 TRINITY_DN8987_c2_g1_i1:53-1165(+)